MRKKKIEIEMETDGPMCDCLHKPGRFKLLLYTIQITHTHTVGDYLVTDRVYPPDAR